MKYVIKTDVTCYLLLLKMCLLQHDKKELIMITIIKASTRCQLLLKYLLDVSNRANYFS